MHFSKQNRTAQVCEYLGGAKAAPGAYVHPFNGETFAYRWRIPAYPKNLLNLYDFSLGWGFPSPSESGTT